MPVSEARFAQGTILEIFNVNEVPTAIAELTNISPSLSSDNVDVTSHDTPSRWRTYIQGLKTAELAIEGNFIFDDPTQSSTSTIGMPRNFDQGTVRHYRITLPTSHPEQWDFEAIISNINFSFPIDAQMSFSATMTVCGPFYLNNYVSTL